MLSRSRFNTGLFASALARSSRKGPQAAVISSAMPRRQLTQETTRQATKRAAETGRGRGSYARFARTLGLWTAGTGAVATAGYYLAKDEIEALDFEEPPTELRMVPGRTYRGYPVIESQRSADGRQQLVVLGSGWGAVSILKTLKPDSYDVVVVSPDNYFIFTPLLPSVTVGTVEFRSVLEAIRRVTKRIRGSYIEATAVDVDFEGKYVLVEHPGEGRAWLPYDRLVVGVGAQSITHGARGLEHCHKLKTIADARSIRQHIMANFEKAVLPTTSDEEKRRLLTFVVCGGGPTGCEFAAELYDFLAEDLKHYFPRSIQQMVSVVIVQSRDHILNMMDSVISEFAEIEFDRRNIKVVTNSRVQQVTPDSIVFSTANPDGSVTEHSMPQGFVLWSTGISLTPFTSLICQRLPDAQKNRHAITVDSHLRVKGIPDGSVYALGDCASIEHPHLLKHISELFDSAPRSKNNEIPRAEFSAFVRKVAAQYPIAATHLQSLVDHFDQFDTDNSNTICMDEFTHMLEFVDNKVTALPALAQVANQEGVYLGRSLNRLAAMYASNELPATVSSELLNAAPHEIAQMEGNAIAPFTYHHRGTLAYLGRAAAADFGEGKAYKGSNLVAKYLWRSVYWSQQVSLRTRILLIMDWTKELLFGRDLSRF
ncbi:hypothetical protein H4217_002927 [Coemansia sp. RSA 1939]|nr:hypothetical protein H4217_002927 [Coemansia sp. RSA 1939]KAJ2613636.1 hypothetical protein EV177_002446 [Coemansia sp. RSA 1804]KAJ2686810.1 hypothetical protein GGH99_003397 [Coemansia sp. RSA 1285]